MTEVKLRELPAGLSRLCDRRFDVAQGILHGLGVGADVNLYRRGSYPSSTAANCRARCMAAHFRGSAGSRSRAMLGYVIASRCSAWRSS
jgi:hypothetical protein